MTTRREFLKAAALGTAACAISPLLQARPASDGKVYAVFTKHLIGLKNDQLADCLAEIGVTAIEAPIRPKGHVEPERVGDDLPKLVESLKKRGIEITILASGINAVDPGQHTEAVLRAAKSAGISRYRMDWYAYDLHKPVWPQLNEIRPKLKDLVALSKEIGILPCYQNHSGGKMVGGPIWDMAMLMRDYKKTELAWCFDIMHATVDGSSSWPIQLNLVSDQIEVAYFKNFRWEGKSHKSAPLGEGIVGPDYVTQLKTTGFSGPVCLHVEYLEGDIKDAGYVKEAVAATRRDLAVLKNWWA